MIWTYETMYKWWTKQGQIKDPLYNIVYAVVYDSQRPKKKDVHKLEPFVKRNIIYVGECPVQNDKLFPEGMYVMYDDNGGLPKSQGSRWLWFVCPKTIDCNGEQVRMGNHFSFCYDKADKNTPIHFHMTSYICLIKPEINSIAYKLDHESNYIPEELNLPGDIPKILNKQFMVPYKQLILELMHHPYEGGGIRNHKKKTQDPKRPKPVANIIRNHGFSSCWDIYGIKNITAIGIVQDDNICFSISIKTRKMRNNSRSLRDAFVLKLPKVGDYEMQIQEYLASVIPRYFDPV